MNTDPITGTQVADSELRAVLAFLRRAPAASTALEIARGTYLSTLVVVPALETLTEQGLAQSQARTIGAARAWTFQLTVQGRRAS